MGDIGIGDIDIDGVVIGISVGIEGRVGLGSGN